MSIRLRSAVVAAVGAGLIATSVLAPSAALAAPSPSPTPTPPPVAAPPVAAPAAPTTPGAPTITKVEVGPSSGQLQVLYTAPASDGGSPVLGYEASIDGGVTWWPCAQSVGVCILTSLTNEKPYTISLRASNAVGPGPASASVTATPTIPPGQDPDKPIKLPKPRVWVNASFNPAGNGIGVGSTTTTKLGVGTLPKLTFDRSIPNKKVVETHLIVKATNKKGKTQLIKGAWGWINDHTAVFRPKDFWPGHATVSIISTMNKTVMGKSGKNYLIGSDSLAKTWTFKTDRALIAKVDGSSDRMKVYIDGKKVKDFGVSLGKSDWETSNGVKVISTLKEPKHTYTSTSLNIDPTKETPYELKDIPWNTRLTPTGEFIHSAPWAYGRIGRYNGSHGCTNMFESDAKWIYDKTIPGDVVLYSKTGGQTVQSWNGPGGLWNIPWKDWVKMSASGSLTGTPAVVTPVPTKPTGSTQSASA